MPCSTRPPEDLEAPFPPHSDMSQHPLPLWLLAPLTSLSLPSPLRCAFSNPSSPYGLVNLPLAPEEELIRKINAKTTPKTVAQVRDNGWIIES